jgi:hypothetical protein
MTNTKHIIFFIFFILFYFILFYLFLFYFIIYLYIYIYIYVYLNKQERYLTGRETLSIQGFPLGFLKPDTDLSDPMLGDMAGNAFSSTVCVAVLLGVFAHVPALVKQPAQAHPEEDSLSNILAMIMEP